MMNFNRLPSFLNCVQTSRISRNHKVQVVTVLSTHNHTVAEIKMPPVLEINVDIF